MYYLINKQLEFPHAKGHSLKDLEEQGEKELKSWTVVGSAADVHILIHYTLCLAIYRNIIGTEPKKMPHSQLAAKLFNELETHDMTKKAPAKTTKKTAKKKTESLPMPDGQYSPIGTCQWNKVPKNGKWQVNGEAPKEIAHLNAQKHYSLNELQKEIKKPVLWRMLNRGHLKEVG